MRTLLGQLLTYTLSIARITLSVVNTYSVGSTHYYITLSVVRIALLVIRSIMSVVHISRSVVHIYSVSSTHYSVGCSATLLCELYALLSQLQTFILSVLRTTLSVVHTTLSVANI